MKKTKKFLILSTTIILLSVLISINFISAEIVISAQPGGLYNVGDVLNFEAKIVASQEINDFAQVVLVCPGAQTEIHKEFIILTNGGEKTISGSFPLMKNFIGSTGTCKIKVSLGEEFVLSEEFKVTDVINVKLKDQKTEYNPGESVIIKGTAVKENGKSANGFVELSMISEDNKILNTSDVVKNGAFEINLSLPKNVKAGQYITRVKVSEKQNSQETNNGFVDITLRVLQVPTSIEINFDNGNEINPGERLRAKTILHDQTGEEMKAHSIITIKDQNNDIILQENVETGIFIEYDLAKSQAPSTWTVVGVSSKLSTELKFNILEKKSVNLQIINKTLIITNDGNVPYNDTVNVKIGEQNLQVPTSLDVGKQKKYSLSAPDGEYQIKIQTEQGNELTGSAILTGNSIKVQEASEGFVRIIRHPVSWIFVLLIFGLVAFFLFKKGYKRSFMGYIKSKKNSNKQETNEEFKPLKKEKSSLIGKITNEAELSLSVKGEKQDSNILCLNIKNFEEITSNKLPETKEGGVRATLNKIVKFAEDKKAHIMEAQDNILFIMAPSSTKTFKNEKAAIEIAKEIEEEINKHNKLFKQKIVYGTSITQGDIIAKKQSNRLTFMAFGTLMNKAKKLAKISNGKIMTDDIMRGRLSSSVKVKKHSKDNFEFYEIEEIKDLPDNSKFINDFKRRMEEDKK